MTQIKIAAINLQSGVATTKGNWQYPLTGWKYWLPHSDKPITEVGKMIKEERIDVACITEISEKSLRTGFRSQTDILKQAAGMDDARFFSSQKFAKALAYEGNALLSRHSISAPASHILHRELNMRMALEEAAVEIEGKAITVFIAHLALTKKHRDIQVKEIIDIVKARKGPFIFAGDFNERDPAALDILLQETPLKHRCTSNTFPSWDPKYPIDYVFLSDEFDVLDCYVPRGPAFSDHLPLVVKTVLA